MFPLKKDSKKIISDIQPPAHGRQQVALDSPEFKKLHEPRIEVTRKPLFIPQQPIVDQKREIHIPERKKIFSPRKKKTFWISIGVVCCVALGASWYIYQSAHVTLVVEQKTTRFDIGDTFTLTVPAELFTSSLVKRGEGVSREKKNFNEKAKGIIIVYNNYSAASQILAQSTRFVTGDNLIFRSTNRVVIPGKEGTKPGSGEVAVIADGSGEKYNVGLTDFTIPGFAGTPKFDKFYGRSKQPGIQGGAIGSGSVVGKNEADELLKKLEANLTGELKDNLTATIPKDTFVVFPEKADYTVTSKITDPPIGSPSDKFWGEVRGDVKTLAVNKVTYANTLAQALFKERYEEGAYALADNSTLSIKNVTFDYTAKTVTLSLGGAALFTWILNINDFRSRILSLSKSTDLNDAFFKNYPAILRVQATYTPNFIKRIPREESRLIIQIQK